jgi:hypothetical protein
VNVNADETADAAYAFGGIPEQLPAGITSFDLTNAGVEHHELRVYREAVDGAFSTEGSTDAFVEIYRPPDRPTPDIAVRVGTGDYTPPGDAVCFIPVGTISEQQPPQPGADPHFLHG